MVGMTKSAPERIPVLDDTEPELRDWPAAQAAHPLWSTRELPAGLLD